MQRELKFRAWDEQARRIINWEELKFDKDNGDDSICFYEKIDDCEWNGGADYKLMQYTGLKDKNGKEIYEGDIVEGGYLNPLTNRFLSKRYIIEYNEGGFCGRLIRHSPYGDTRLEFIEGEVIGNIYSNPELLKEGE